MIMVCGDNCDDADKELKSNILQLDFSMSSKLRQERPHLRYRIKHIVI